MSDPIWESITKQGVLGGSQVHFFECLDSTNRKAAELAGQGAADWTLVVADCQTAGRGRLGKKWQSPPGTGLYCSMICRPALAPVDLPKITLATGVALCCCVEKLCGIAPLLKWPNDLLIDGKKAAGILVEQSGGVGATAIAVVGIGVNVNTPREAFPLELQNTATSLLLAGGRAYTRGVLLEMLLAEVQKKVKMLEEGGFKIILEQWKSRDALKGRQLSWLTPQGGVVNGVSLGPDQHGFLHIRDRQGRVHQVLSGDVSITVVKGKPVF